MLKTIAKIRQIQENLPFLDHSSQVEPLPLSLHANPVNLYNELLQVL